MDCQHRNWLEKWSSKIFSLVFVPVCCALPDFRCQSQRAWVEGLKGNAPPFAENRWAERQLRVDAGRGAGIRSVAGAAAAGQVHVVVAALIDPLPRRIGPHKIVLRHGQIAGIDGVVSAMVAGLGAGPHQGLVIGIRQGQTGQWGRSAVLRVVVLLRGLPPFTVKQEEKNHFFHIVPVIRKGKKGPLKINLFYFILFYFIFIDRSIDWLIYGRKSLSCIFWFSKKIYPSIGRSQILEKKEKIG